jgi:hypothetical protein
VSRRPPGTVVMTGGWRRSSSAMAPLRIARAPGERVQVSWQLLAGSLMGASDVARGGRRGSATLGW